MQQSDDRPGAVKLSETMTPAAELVPNHAVKGVNSGLVTASWPVPAPKTARSDSSHWANQPRSVPVSPSRQIGSQSKSAHHSTKAPSPSMTGVTRSVAWKDEIGSDGSLQNS